MKQGALLDVDPHVRRAFDFYETPAWMTRALLRRYPFPGNRYWTIVEPCAGDGAILRELPQAGHKIIDNDFDLSHVGRQFHLDATKRATWEAFTRVRNGYQSLEVVVTNPPFNVSLPIVELAYEYATIGVAMLLRLSWLEPTEEEHATRKLYPRGPFLEAHPPTRIIVLPRWGFRKQVKTGTDMVCCAWFLWAKQPWFCEPGIEVVTKREMRELQA